MFATVDDDVQFQQFPQRQQEFGSGAGSQQTHCGHIGTVFDTKFKNDQNTKIVILVSHLSQKTIQTKLNYTKFFYIVIIRYLEPVVEL